MTCVTGAGKRRQQALGGCGYRNWMSAVAMPRKEKKPAMSVTVVRMIEDEVAGS